MHEVPNAYNARLLSRMAARLESLREQSQFRVPEILSGVNLFSNDYLALSDDPRLKRAAVEALERAARVGGTGSRLLSGNNKEWESLEADFAEFTGTAAALYFSSGYAANVGLLSCVAGRGDLVFSDALNHASLIDGIRLSGAQKIIYPHCDLDFLERALRKRTAASGAKLIVTESVFSMEGDVVPLRDIFEMARKFGAEVVVDEAHALGVRGPHGRGVLAELGLEREALAIVFTCGKALASAGAFACGSRVLREFLVNHARSFIFSTANPPYFAGQIRAALALAREADDRRTHLESLGKTLRQQLAAAGLDTGASMSQIVPVIVGSNNSALHFAAELQREGFAVKAIRPPTVPPNTSRLRLSLTAHISHTDIARLVRAMIAARQSLPASLAFAHA